MYGVPPKERSWFGSNNLLYGTAFLGKILMKMSLLPNERPQLATFTATSVKEPTMINYSLWVDVYELQNAKDCGDRVWVTIHIGQHNEKSKKAGASQVFMGLNK